ncbi:putative secreted protein [gamma proteobacterium BDW918]|nr:putative secreted protein [gamma proteobacterium BDW918]
MRILKLAVALISISSIAAGCATKEGIIPTPEQDMKTVYEQHMNGVGEGKILDKRAVLRRPMHVDDVELSDYVRTEATALRSRFRLLPNPTLYMFVAPHLAGESGVPIPGYLTEFKMWETDNYALPGEVSTMEPDYQDGGQ